MARIDFSLNFLRQQELLKKIIDKHTHDGAGSVLHFYLNEQDIDLSADQTAGAKAVEHEENRAAFTREKENLREQRDNHFNPVFKNMKAAGQFLKTLSGKRTKLLRQWGLPALVSGRIKYPSNFDKRLEIFFDFYQKYKELPAADSPLAAFLIANEIDLDADNAKALEAKTLHKNFSAMGKIAEDEHEKRNLKWEPVVVHLRGIGQFLFKLFVQHPKVLGEWGFVVVEAARDPKVQISKVDPGNKLKLRGLVLGSLIEHLGEGELLLYRGGNEKKPPVILSPEKPFTVAKGYTVTTIVNEKPQQYVKISCVIQR